MSDNNLRPDDQHQYMVNPETLAEMTRLEAQGRSLTRVMGGLFNEIADMNSYHRVLDIACGPGTWAQEMAVAYPHLEVVGIDISQRMIAYAASRKTTNNVSFQVMNILNPLKFPDESFDIINARLLMAVVPSDKWPDLIQECRRILRPGGLLRLTEPEYPITNGVANEQFNRWMIQALALNKQSYMPGDNNIGITCMLRGFLADAGFQDIQHRAFVSDPSAGSPINQEFFEDVQVAYLLVRPFFLKAGIATEEEIKKVYDEAMKEIQSPDFRALAFFLTVCGKK